MKLLSIISAGLLLPTFAIAQNVINPNFSSQAAADSSTPQLTQDIQSNQASLAKLLNDNQSVVNQIKMTLSGPGAKQASELYKKGGSIPSNQSSTTTSNSPSSYKITLSNQSSQAITIISTPTSGGSSEANKATIKANSTVTLLTPNKSASLSATQGSITANCGTTQPGKNYSFTINGSGVSLICTGS